MLGLFFIYRFQSFWLYNHPFNRKVVFPLQYKNKLTGEKNYYPCFRYAKYLMEQGVIGEVQDVYAQHLKESALWEGRRLEWRFQKICRAMAY